MRASTLAIAFTEAEMNYLRAAASDARLPVEDLVASYVREIIRDDIRAEAQ